VTAGQRNPSCPGSYFHPLTDLTGRSHKIVCQYRGWPGRGRGGGQPRPLTALDSYVVKERTAHHQGPR
jgi:hypothetical protein